MTQQRHCYRFIAVDVNTKLDHGRLVKHVRCLDYYHDASSPHSAVNGAAPTEHGSLDNISVFLYDDW